MDIELRKPWLIAVWPGMGGVAQIAGTYLVRQLGAQPLLELDPTGFFESNSIHVKAGLVQPAELPRSVLYAWRDPAGRRDLLVLLGDRQPDLDVHRYAQALLEIAARHDVERVFTFAAMATPIHPTAEPRVFAVTTNEELLPELLRERVTLLDEGEITGLNGIFVASAQARGLPSVCLLGEFPFFAAPVPNPKASAAVLSVFAEIAGIEIDLREILADARKIERGLVQHLEGLQRAAQLAAPQSEQPQESDDGEEPVAEEEEPSPFGASLESTRARRRISPEVLERIERLFAAARENRARALELKAELDRQELFKQFEDRFLDLFKQGG